MAKNALKLPMAFERQSLIRGVSGLWLFRSVSTLKLLWRASLAISRSASRSSIELDCLRPEVSANAKLVDQPISGPTRRTMSLFPHTKLLRAPTLNLRVIQVKY